ncbi:MAG: ribosome biogenesis GTPase Der [Spirochaetes bacterium]|nr:ribosome biogenesis GTPase Der [Spirochaetota bacterium]
MKKKLPHVSIIGRRNVGKSTLFNAIIKQKLAIVDNIPGLTRDIINYNVEYNDYNFILSDTPGLDLPDTEELSKNILDNAVKHLQNSALIILLLENPQLDSFDHELVSMTRKLKVPTIMAINKMDDPQDMENLINFYELGISEFIPISAKYKKNFDLLFTKICENIQPVGRKINEPDIKIALAGRPNSGKSTLLNQFMGQTRSIVSDIPGTTRDSVKDTFQFENRTVEIVDTAGIRKKRNIKTNVEYFSLTRTIESISKCDVVIHLIDAEAGLTETDKKIADEILKAHKPIIIAINKWDLIEKDHKTFKEYCDRLTFHFYRAADFPIISVSAKDKVRIHKLLTTAFDLKIKAESRISTSKLNQHIEAITKQRKLPTLGRDLKIYYATQVDTIPPQFKFFVNDAKIFKEDVIRFFQKELQKIMNLKGIPIVIKIEGKPPRDKNRAVHKKSKK